MRENFKGRVNKIPKRARTFSEKIQRNENGLFFSARQTNS